MHHDRQTRLREGETRCHMYAATSLAIDHGSPSFSVLMPSSTLRILSIFDVVTSDCTVASSLVSSESCIETDMPGFVP